MFNIALLGAGRIGQVHAANIASHAATTLWSVVDPNQEFATRLATQYQARQQSLDEAMTDPNVHAVLIASATDRPRGADLFHGICIYIQENFHRPITRDSIAHRFNVSASHLSHLFREQGHMRLADYISWVRIDRAKFMLKKYRFRLEEVASRCGYSDVNYFCRVFKQKTGLTPTQYRSLSQPQNQSHELA